MISSRAVLREALRNLEATPIRTVLVVLLAIAAGFGVVTSTATDTSGITRRFAQQARAGRFVLVVEATDPAGFEAARCDAFGAVPGVEAAGATLPPPPAVRSANRPTYPYDQIRVTPGMLGVLYPGVPLGRAASRPGVLVGPAAARDLGLVEGGILRSRAGRDVPIAGVLPHSPRRPEVDAKIVSIAAPTVKVRECDVATEPDRVEAVQLAALGWFDAGERPVISPFLDRSLGRTPERELDDRASAWGWVAALALLAVLHLSSWFARRQELALYRLLGLSPGRLLLLLATEAAASILLPVVVGGSVGIARAHIALTASVPRSLTELDLASLLASLVVLPAVAGAALLLRRPLDDLKGA